MGLGERFPIARNGSTTDRFQNHRVENQYQTAIKDKI